MHASRLQAGRSASTCSRRLIQCQGLHTSLAPFVNRTAGSSHCATRCAGSASHSFEPVFNSMENLRNRQQMQQLQSLQQHRQQQYQQQGLGTQASGEETELLWAGYSALEEQLQRHHRRHDALVAQIHELQVKLQTVQQLSPPTTWQAASFLLFFLFFINFVGMLVNFQMGCMWPWTAAKASATTVWFRSMLSVAVPFTNTVVILIFCMQAVKAAWTCLKW